MQKKVQSFLEKYQMISPGDRVIAAVSGGADSVCLLLVLHKLSRTMGFSLKAVHVEHGIRGEESLRDAAFTEALCRELGIAFSCCSVDAPAFAAETHQSLEEAARELRYRSLLSEAEAFGADRIAVAHHADDCAETVLFHLARGTGLRGLGGILPVTERRAETSGRVYKVIRPMLALTKAEILAWLDGKGQDYCIDSTNQDESYARNRIRGSVIPQLTQVNEQAVSHICETARQMEELSSYMDEMAERAKLECCEPFQDARAGICGASQENDDKAAACGELAGNSGIYPGIRIKKDAFKKLHPVLQKQLLLKILGQTAGSQKDITSVHVERLRSLFDAETGKQISLPYRMRAEVFYDVVLLGVTKEPGRIRDENGDETPLSVDLAIPGETIWHDETIFQTKIVEFRGYFEEIPRNRYTKWFDYDKIKQNVHIRTRQAGDFLTVDAAGGHKKLKNYFIDQKIPRRQRDRQLLLADGSHILWVVGSRISEAYKVTAETKRVLCVEAVFKVGSEENSQ